MDSTDTRQLRDWAEADQADATLPELPGVRIIRAWNQLPYTGGYRIPEPVTAAGIATALGVLARNLASVAADAERAEAELARFRQQQRAVRDFLGL